jgi:hypothetical protein
LFHVDEFCFLWDSWCLFSNSSLFVLFICAYRSLSRCLLRFWIYGQCLSDQRCGSIIATTIDGFYIKKNHICSYIIYKSIT